jgi:hypothetical protein
MRKKKYKVYSNRKKKINVESGGVGGGVEMKEGVLRNSRSKKGYK